MIDYEQLRAAIDRKLGTDPEFRTIMKRITEGRANFIDTARYSQVIAHTLGNELSKAVLELSDREAITKQLLHENYSDINDVFGRVQNAMDQKKGINLRQQIAPFPEERVDKFSHALVDPTVEDSVIKRRARAGSETITKSFHDDCIEVNAEFREEAGLKCYIERIGTDCCQWCSDVAGKYEMKDQPQGIFRRHDNCDCTIIYDGQVLRGEAGDNGKRSKKWVEVPKDAGAAGPVRLTKEQAAATGIETPKRYSQAEARELEYEKIHKKSIDISLESDIIEPKKQVSSIEFAVPKDLTESHAFRAKFNKMSDNPEIQREYYQAAKEMLRHRSGTNGEDLYFYNTRTQKWTKSTTGTLAGSPEYTPEILAEIEASNKGEIVAFHNHPLGMPPSASDFNAAYDNGYGVGYTIGHNGRIYEYTAPKYKIPEVIYNSRIANYQKEGLSLFEAEIKALEDLKPLYRFEYREVM